jgi:mRNA interferase RelE/StbE
MNYRIELADETGADLEGLYKSDRRLFKRILSKIETLSDKPFEGKPLVGNHKGEYSFRVGNYRIIYELDTKGHFVFVLTVKHRKHVY